MMKENNQLSNLSVSLLGGGLSQQASQNLVRHVNEICQVCKPTLEAFRQIILPETATLGV